MMKFLNKNVNDCVQHIILQKFTNFHAIWSWNFRIFAMRWWPRSYCATLYKLALCIQKKRECASNTRTHKLNGDSAFTAIQCLQLPFLVTRRLPLARYFAVLVVDIIHSTDDAERNDEESEDTEQKIRRFILLVK